MTTPIIFSLPGNELLTQTLSTILPCELGEACFRNFPDGETYVRILSEVKDKITLLVCTLDHPNSKILPLMFMAETLKSLGAKQVYLVAPYLAYMRQDISFHAGEAVNAKIFAKTLSSCMTGLITIDPHLHRIHDLAEIYALPFIATLHATSLIADWVARTVPNPLIVGPDSESQQWVASVAEQLNAKYAVVQKIRNGDRNIEIIMPTLPNPQQTPVIVDDIISTGTSMAAVIQQLIQRGFNKPICITVHALFDQAIYDNLLAAGASKVISCNTIPHFTNEIDVTELLADKLRNKM